mmetsp:Transcript_42868/g.134515  ORF Transcript_42868/g.134515 Transcript_42868/m.134515 type:complete len:111 (-) Transcript_42868:456-788(-)
MSLNPNPHLDPNPNPNPKVMWTTRYHKCYLFLGEGRPPQAQDQHYACRSFVTDHYWDDFMKGKLRKAYPDGWGDEEPPYDERTWFGMIRFREAFLKAWRPSAAPTTDEEL